MGLFSRNFDRPGPGVPKNAPRKKGLARFGEVLGRDFSNLVKLNFLYFLCLLPAQICLFFICLFMIAGGGLIVIILAVLGLAACLLVGPATTAVYYIITKMLRDEPGFVWTDFKKLFKENFRPMAVPGILYGLIVGAQVFAVVYYTAPLVIAEYFPELSSLVVPAVQTNWVMTLVYLISLLLFTMTAPYFFVQAGYLDLRGGGLLKNSILLSLGYLPRSFMGAVLGSVFTLLLLFFFPFSVSIAIFVYPLFGYTLPMLMNLMWVWPPVNKTFQIEKTLVEREGGVWIDPDPPPPPPPDDDDEDEDDEDDAYDEDGDGLDEDGDDDGGEGGREAEAPEEDPWDKLDDDEHDL